MAVATSPWSVRVSLPVDPAGPSHARDFVGFQLHDHGLPDLVDDVRLVVSELATNAMLHAKTPFSVTLAQSGQVVTLAVKDGSSTIPSETPGDLMDVEGRGVSLVQRLSSRWGVTRSRDGSKFVWASFETTRD